MDKKTRPLYMLSTREEPQNKDTHRLKVKVWKKIFHANRDQKKAGEVILIPDKIDLKTKAVKKDKEGHYIMIKVSHNYCVIVDFPFHTLSFVFHIAMLLCWVHIYV